MAEALSFSVPGLRIDANADLALDGSLADGGRTSVWEMEGIDPAWRITATAWRRATWIVMELESLRDPIDPIVFLPSVTAFSERRSATLPLGPRHVLVAAIPAFGTMRRLRLDPASAPGRVRLRLATYSSEREAVAHALARAHAEGLAPAHLERLRRVPRVDGALARRIVRLSQRKRTLARKLQSFARDAPRNFVPPGTADTASPWLSIVVPVHDAKPRHLDELLASVAAQNAGAIELILSDDASCSPETIAWLNAQAERGENTSVRCLFAESNAGIGVTTNRGIAAARGTWIALLDHDDVLLPGVLRAAAVALADRPEARYLYTDEVVVDDALKPRRLTAKPAFDPVMLTGANYLNHLSFYRADHLANVGRMHDGFDGSQDYELVLRVTRGLADDAIVHLPYPGYGWRRTGETYSARFIERSVAHARKAIIKHLSDRLAGGPWRVTGIEGAVTPTLHRPMIEPAHGHDWPGVTVIVPSRDAPELVRAAVRGVLDETDYPDLELIVVDNGSTRQEVLAFYETQASVDPRFRADIVAEPFNFSRSINRGMALAGDRHCLLLNDDVTVMHADWLKEMVSCLALGTTEAPVGIVGAKLLYPNGTLQHAGVTVGAAGLAVHRHGRKAGDTPGPLCMLHVRNTTSAVTGAVMLLSAETIARLGPWDEQNFAVAYNDVDYCMRARAAGIRTVWTPFATLTHHESISRGPEVGSAKRERFKREKLNLQRIHKTATFIDPAAPKLDEMLLTGEKARKLRQALAKGRTWFDKARDSRL